MKKYVDRTLLSVKKAHYHMRILLNHMTYSISQETCYLFYSFTCNSSLPKTLKIELPLSAKHSWTISIPESSSLAVSWLTHVSLLHDLFCTTNCKSASYSLELVPLLAVIRWTLPDVVSSCSFAEKKNVLSRS